MNIPVHAALSLLNNLGHENPLCVFPVHVVTDMEKEGLQALSGIQTDKLNPEVLAAFLDDLAMPGVSEGAKAALRILLPPAVFSYADGNTGGLKIMEYIVCMSLPDGNGFYGTEYYAHVYLSSAVYAWWKEDGYPTNILEHLSQRFAPVVSGFHADPVSPSVIRGLLVFCFGKLSEEGAIE